MGSLSGVLREICLGEREREREREGKGGGGGMLPFKSPLPGKTVNMRLRQ